MAINADDLESAISSAKVSSAKSEPAKEPEDVTQMPKEEETGFHKGALNTLVAERNELIKMIGNVEAIMQAHIGRLKELGVKITDTKDGKQ